MKLKKISVSVLCASLMFGGILSAFATAPINNSTSFDFTESGTSSQNAEVVYNQSATYHVTIPKAITLGSNKQSVYSVKVEGDIPSNKQVYVSPIDAIADTPDVFDFYMKDLSTKNPKADVRAIVTQSKFYWDFRNVADAYEATDNAIIASGLTAGSWKGTFNFEIAFHNLTAYSLDGAALVDAIQNLSGDKAEVTAFKTSRMPVTDADSSINLSEPQISEPPVNETAVSETARLEFPKLFTKAYAAELTTETTSNPDDIILYRKGRELTLYAPGTVKVRNSLAGLFYDYTSLTSVDFSNLDTSEATDMSNMFTNCESLNTVDLRSFDTNNVTNMDNMFKGCSSLQAVYVSSKWDASETETSRQNMFAESNISSVTYKVGQVNPSHVHSYTAHVDREASCVVAGIKVYLCACGYSYTEDIAIVAHNYGSDDKCTMCNNLHPNHKHSYDETGICVCGEREAYLVAPENAIANWNYTLDNTNNIVTLNYYVGSETDVIVYGSYPVSGKTYKTQLASNTANADANTKYMFNASAQTNCGNIQSITFSNAIDTSNVTDMSYMFYCCYNLTSLNLSNFNTSNVTNMGEMFYYCQSLTSLDVISFDTSNVTDMNFLFSGCNSLTSLDVSSFNTGNVTEMYGMFNGCTSLTSLDVNNFNTSKVTDMSGMFENCISLTSLDLSGFNTSKVTDMSYMFENCTSLTSLDLSSFNTSNVTNMSYMFYNCTSLTNLDLSSFNTSNVKNMHYMFGDSINLKTIYVTSGKWDTSNARKVQMFDGCGTSSVTYR